jgi:hypothetical protein
MTNVIFNANSVKKEINECLQFHSDVWFFVYEACADQPRSLNAAAGSDLPDWRSQQATQA